MGNAEYMGPPVCVLLREQLMKLYKNVPNVSQIARLRKSFEI